MADRVPYNGTQIYGTSKYYGRLAPDELGAQNATSRETGLKVIITDERLNAWESVLTGEELQPTRNQEYYNENETAGLRISPFYDRNSWEYAWYRYDSYTIKMGNGSIVRARAGDGSVGDSRLWYQIITDPTSAAQWQAWTMLYSGAHRAVALHATAAASFTVLHSKLTSSGLQFHAGDVLVGAQSAITDVIKIEPLSDQPASATCLAHIAAIRSAGATTRKVDWFYSPSVTATTVSPLTTNYRWDDQAVFGRYDSSTRADWIYSVPAWSNPRDKRIGPTLIHTQWPTPSASVADVKPTGWFPIRGVGGSADRNRIAGMRMVKLSDGYYYLFYSEYQPAYLTTRTAEIYSKHLPVFWQRSRDLKHWTVPVFTGISGIFKPFIFESGGYVYLTGNGDVYRRPATSVEYDISNYVPKVRGRIPSDNTAAKGQLVIANPDGVNDALKELADRPIKIQPGIKDNAGKFQFFDIGKWWVSSITDEVDGQVSRLVCRFGDILNRLDNPLLDTHNFPGRFSWSDWSTGKPNALSNYFFENDPNPTIVGNRLQLFGRGIYAGSEKFHNGRVAARFRRLDTTLINDQYLLIFRYTDATHFWWAMVDPNTEFVSIGFHTPETGFNEIAIEPTGYLLGSDSFDVAVEFFFGKISVYIDDELKLTTSGATTDYINTFTHSATENPANTVVAPGLVGFHAATDINLSADPSFDYQVSKFEARSDDDPLEIDDLARTACAMGDLHQVSVPSGNLPDVYALAWGPQTDSLTPAAGLKKALDEQGFKLVWRNNAVCIGRFQNTNPYKTLENQLIDSSTRESDEAGTNIVVVDGNTHSWVQMDVSDLQSRGWPKIRYFDSPALMTYASVKDKARQELEQASKPSGISGSAPMWFDLEVMDLVGWTDNLGNNYPKVRLTGIEFEIDQGTRPFQRVSVDGTVI